MCNYLSIVFFVTLALALANGALNCSVCQLDDSFNESNGYGCFEINSEKIACTCPDQRYEMNEPCRICKRENICGNNPNTFCAETSSKFLGDQTNNLQYYACFCSDKSFQIGAPCPSIPLPTNSTTTK